MNCGCPSGKPCLATKRIAGETLWAVRLKRIKDGVEAGKRETARYPCPHCVHWHLTSERGRRLTVNRRRKRRKYGRGVWMGREGGREDQDVGDGGGSDEYRRGA